MIEFLLGIIIGLLIRDIKYETLKVAGKVNNKYEEKLGEKSQFIDSESLEDKYKKSENITKFLDKL